MKFLPKKLHCFFRLQKSTSLFTNTRYGRLTDRIASLLRRPTHQSQLPQNYSRVVSLLEDRPTVYVCHNFICDLPVQTPEQLREKLL